MDASVSYGIAGVGGYARSYSKIISDIQYPEPYHDESGAFHNRNVTFNGQDIDVYFGYSDRIGGQIHDPIDDCYTQELHITSINAQNPPTGGELIVTEKTISKATPKCYHWESGGGDRYAVVEVSGFSSVTVNGIVTDYTALNGTFNLDKFLEECSAGLNEGCTVYTKAFATPLVIIETGTPVPIYTMNLQLSDWGPLTDTLEGSITYNGHGPSDSYFHFGLTNRHVDVDGVWSISPNDFRIAAVGNPAGAHDIYTGLVQANDPNFDFILNAQGSVTLLEELPS